MVYSLTMELKNPELQGLINDKSDGYKYQERRRADWRENYTLGRDKVTYNRLTQRQSVNIPLMKTVQKTYLKGIDKMPLIFFQNLDNDRMSETLWNEYWKKTLELNKMVIKDYVDKKQEFYFGRTFDQMQVVNGLIKWTITDPHDIRLPRYIDPTDIDSGRFFIHTHIFTPLSILEANKDYDQEAVARLKDWFGTTMGLIKAKDNFSALEEKNQIMSDMGLDDVNEPILGETYAELTLHFKKDDKDEFILYVEVEDQEILMRKPLEEVIGVTSDHFWRTHLPYNSWASDVENQDAWPDGLADIVRTPNKIVNSWFSQKVENRTLRNFGMNYYDSTIEGFVPPSVTPMPWGWYGVPGKPSEVFQKVDIPELGDINNDMEFIQTIVEKATGAVATQQGVVNKSQTTLGEVQLALQQAKERTDSVSKFYTQAWEDRGLKFIKLLEAASDKLDTLTVSREGKNSNAIYSMDINPSKILSKKGYKCKVWSQDDKDSTDRLKVAKLNQLKLAMPDNPAVDDVWKRKLTELADLTPEETNKVMEFEDQKRQMMMNQPQQIDPATGQPIQQNPMQPTQPNQQQGQPAPMPMM